MKPPAARSFLWMKLELAVDEGQDCHRCSSAAGADSNSQVDPRGIHTPSLSTSRRDGPVAVVGFDQLNVKAWLMRRI
ncbi:hypothetical protein HNQ36_002505 [Afipia massiliensis]|uniref:Uncharacterized protein n=1 Tax=Afipia massiliensis TaxID=211460 RepID=A0A840N3X2_9BRAD|nr:hypothetical protein [Afipia massiliensis]MBB5052531.1 hypothetical protein [Afipia massiliensis]